VARQGGSDPNMNPSLRAVIQKAKSVNMLPTILIGPIKKGAGKSKAQYLRRWFMRDTRRWSSVVVVALTDNRNRAASEIRHILQTRVRFRCPRLGYARIREKGQIFVDSSIVEEDKLMDVSFRPGARTWRGTATSSKF